MAQKKLPLEALKGGTKHSLICCSSNLPKKQLNELALTSLSSLLLS